MDLSGWTYLLTFGYDLDIYAKGNRRVGIDRNTGEVVIEYGASETMTQLVARNETGK